MHVKSLSSPLKFHYIYGMKTEVKIDLNTEAGKKAEEIIKKMIENQDKFREAVQSGQAIPKSDARPV